MLHTSDKRTSKPKRSEWVNKQRSIPHRGRDQVIRAGSDSRGLAGKYVGQKPIRVLYCGVHLTPFLDDKVVEMKGALVSARGWTGRQVEGRWVWLRVTRVGATWYPDCIVGTPAYEGVNIVRNLVHKHTCTHTTTSKNGESESLQ